MLDARTPRSNDDSAAMSADEAIAWLRRVDGELYRTAPGRTGREAWVAVVRTPRASGEAGKMIVALGETLQDAAASAAQQWRAVWRTIGTLH